MKASLLLLAIANLVVGIAHNGTAPEGCKKLSSDSDWPPLAEWRAAMPEVEVHKQTAKAKHPDYVLQAESYKDVSAAVKFCAKNSIRLVIIASGHDFLGRNDGPSGLTLDVSLLKGVRVLESFTPTAQGAERPLKKANVIVPVPGRQAAVTFGVGVPAQQLHNAVYPSKLLTIGAAHGSVSVAGGWGLTGGHGPLTHKYGLGVDQFLEFKVVTADGEIKVANDAVNQDLFWALRGGGGSTFGVVVEATVKAYPNERITAADFFITTKGSPYSDGLWSAYTYFTSQMPSMVKAGVSGYFYIQPNSISTLMIHPGDIAGTAKTAAFWKPHLDKMASFQGMNAANLTIFNYGSYKHYFDAHFGSVDDIPDEGCVSGMKQRIKRHGPGGDMMSPTPNGAIPLDSRLLGAEHLQSPVLKEAWMKASPGIQGHLVANPDLKVGNTSVLPAWRKAYVHMIGTRVGNWTSVDSLRRLAPEMGAYANEAFYASANWKTEFWGENYDMLSKIKTRYDPNFVFWTTPGINADFMEVKEGGRLCRVANGGTSNLPPKNDNQNIGSGGGGAINSAGFGTAPKGKSGCA
ncbi:FAD-binding domain-containing protein [Tothia fuscella]|uniref:FAD-binding domain-containing protein n=1 Tax=Tothia fuscella TaxID=1048955 RepID=A0A9P4P4Y1_9PEZI|nr:FAD-binding domain-containing protein [Tothia fuscella]